MVSLNKVFSGLRPETKTEPNEAEFNMKHNGLSDLSSCLGYEVRGKLDTDISAVQYDSRRVKPGDMFVCIPGLKADGHDFAAKAVAQGAAVLVVEKWLDLPVTQLKVPDSRACLGILAASFFGWPTDALRVCGVTGTNGKTTITHLIEHILNKASLKTGIIGTLGARIGGSHFPGTRTTPEASDLQELLADMVQRDACYAVMEVSSHALDLHRVAGCEYDIAVFTNLTQDHLDFHLTMQDYLAAKGKLFRSLGEPARKSGCKYALINIDDPSSGALFAQTRVKALGYGINSAADYRAEGITNTPAGVSFEAVFPGGRTRLQLKTPGLFTVYNALAAFAVGVEEGLEAQFVADALAEVKGVAGRFEPVDAGQPFGVIVDYAHTPDSLENVLNTAREFVRGKIITVFGCGGDRDRSKRPVMGEIAAKLSDLVIVTSDNPRSEDPASIIADIKPGIEKVTGDYKVQPDRKEAISWACAQASAGDIVLIAGKGHEDYQEILGHKYPFDDRAVAAECLGRLGYGKVNA